MTDSVVAARAGAVAAGTVGTRKMAAPHSTPAPSIPTAAVASHRDSVSMSNPNPVGTECNRTITTAGTAFGHLCAPVLQVIARELLGSYKRRAKRHLGLSDASSQPPSGA